MSFHLPEEDDLNGEFGDGSTLHSLKKFENSNLRLMDDIDLESANEPSHGSRQSRREDYRSHREKRHSHRDRNKYHKERRHRSDDNRDRRYHRKRYNYESSKYDKHKRVDHSKGNLLGSKNPDSCKYDVQTVKDIRNSNRDSENHRTYESEKEIAEPSQNFDNNEKLCDLFESDFKEEAAPPEKRAKLDDNNESERDNSSTESNPSTLPEQSDDEEKAPSPVSPTILENSEKSQEEDESKIDYDETLPPYYPAIEGCRSLDEFQCLNRIAEGTYGVVYRFRDKRTQDIVALKKLKMEKEKEGFPITSLREINTLLKGQHPNIITVREIVVGSNMDKIFIVMDYVEHDLKSLIEMMRQKDQHFTPGEVKCLLKQLLAAVAHLHDNWILHRDLKTSNLLFSHKGILKVGDFGLAREYGSPLRPYTPIVVTLWYRAPELLLCAKEYSTPIDMWSVGCIFAEFLLMNALFPGKTEVEQLNRICKCLGTPSEKIWPGYNKLPAVQKIKIPNYQMSNLRKKFQMLSDLGLNFLLNFLTYDPQQRVTAEDALKHPYFNEFPTAIDPSTFPTWPAKSENCHKRESGASPKAPSGGGEFKKLGDEDGFRIGVETDNSRKGAGFSLKF